MKFNLRVIEEIVYMVDNSGDAIIWLYHPNGDSNYFDQHNFWLCPDWRGDTLGNEASEDYHKHRDEYIAEAKKLIVKEML